jgi:hypothetical protein
MLFRDGGTMKAANDNEQDQLRPLMRMLGKEEVYLGMLAEIDRPSGPGIATTAHKTGPRQSGWWRKFFRRSERSGLSLI